MSFVSTIFKRSTAAFLLVLLVIVFASKAIHHHTADRHSNHLTISVHNGDCAICAFELAKDADVVLPLDIQVFPPTGQITWSNLSIKTPVKAEYCLSGRAPPAFCS